MSAVVVDTHSLLWYLNNSLKLSAVARLALEAAETARLPIYVPAITIVELRYLVEKRTITEADYATILAALKDANTALMMAPLDLTAADATSAIPRAIVPDMPDRIIAATALALKLPLVTCDNKIRALTNVVTLW